MKNKINILFVEDSKNDCDILLNHLRENGYDPNYMLVASESAMIEALQQQNFDIVLCDFHMPAFSVKEALDVLKSKAPLIPLIVVSGTVDERTAVKALKNGVSDYILKNNLSRLIPAIERELVDVNTRAVHLAVERELKKKELELRQAQKLEAVGLLAGGIAHDFNNILAVILMQVENASTALNENSELRKSVILETLEQISKSANRAASLTRQLLAFSRNQLIQPRVLDLNVTIREMEKMLSRLIEENIKLELDLASDCGNIKADLGHLEQVIMNLVVNSRDAMPNGGKIKIRTSKSHISVDTAMNTNSVPGTYILLEIIDTGVGIPESIIKRIFDPFFTTKEVGKGTGLGLSTVYGIVKQNKGLIFVESKVNEGATFKVYFPLVNEVVQTSKSVVTEIKKLEGTETILVAEDDADLRGIVCKTLRKSGYTVLEAENGSVALDIMKSHQEIGLVVTDVMMPKMGGRELSERARNLKLSSKFLFLSGYTQDVLLQQGITSGESYFMAKPYVVKELLKKIRSIVEGNE